jgi:hypothetical protein
MSLAAHHFNALEAIAAQHAHNLGSAMERDPGVALDLVNQIARHGVAEVVSADDDVDTGAVFR